MGVVAYKSTDYKYHWSMILWRVDVCDVTHRYVEARSPEHAAEQVRTSITNGKELRVTAATDSLSIAFAGAGKIKKRKMLDRLDGLTNPHQRRSSKAAKRKLRRLVENEEQELAWLKGAVETLPPISPESLDRLIRLQSISHIEQNHDRLSDWDRDQPLLGD
jgi:hypothetical protein